MTAEVLAGRYELRGLLGRGGMAEVRDAWDTRLHRNVAVKLLYPAQSGDAAARARFEDEARSAARLSHPNIVAIHDFGEHEDAPFIVMERLPGRTLADLIEQGPLPAVRVRRMLDEVLAALAVAHSAGVLHRDIKPANILLSAEGNSVKVADFGIAKSGGSAHTATGTIVGTMSYLSPQRVTGAPASVSDDLYAVGVMGYEALLGRRAFPQDNPAALARAILDVPPPPLRVLGTDADPALCTAIDRAMSRDPRLRFGSAAQMRAALAGDPAALGVEPVTVLTGPPQPPSTRVMAQPFSGPFSGPFPPPARYPTAPPTAPPTRARKYLLAVAAVLAFAVAALALALEPFSSPAPLETVSTSTPVPPRTTTAPPTTPTPLSTAPAAVVPAVEPPAPREGPKKGPPDKKGGPGNNGHGNGKPN